MGKLTRWARRVTFRALKVLPRPLRYAAIRNRFRLDEAQLATIDSVHIASTVDEYLQAAKLVHDGYVDRGILRAHGAGVRMSHFLLLPSSVIFVALEQGQVVGTVSLVLDGPVGLPMEKVYPTEVAAARAEGRQLAEVGALCVAPGKRAVGVQFLLYKAMWLAATRLLGVDDFVIAVHPSAADLYGAMLLFEAFGPVRQYPTLDRTAVAVPLRMRVREAPITFKEAFGHLPPTIANPYWLYGTRVEPQIHLPAEPVELGAHRERHRSASMKLMALRPDIVTELNTGEFNTFRQGLAP